MAIWDTPLITADKHLIIDKIIPINSDVAYPSGVALSVKNGGGFSIVAGKTLTINGPLEAGGYQIFFGDGFQNVVGLSEARGRWWGGDAVPLSVAAGIERRILSVVETADLITGGPYVDVRKFPTLAAAVADASTAGKTILIGSAVSLSANLTIPADRALKVIKGGSINVSSGNTLTIYGPFEAGMYQIFTGAGSVVFGPGAVMWELPQWRGVAGISPRIVGDNVVLGDEAAKTLTSPGARSVAVGAQSLKDVTSGVYNTGVGYGTLTLTTTGGNNTAVGYIALDETTTGNNNTAVGSNALRRNTTGNDNVAIGVAAMERKTIGYDNVAVGNNALAYDLETHDNIAIGARAMYEANRNLGATFASWANVAVGVEALYGNIHDNQVVDGNFAAPATNWTLGAGWVAGSGKVTKTTDGVGTVTPTAGGVAYIDFGVGNKFTITYTVSDWTAGTITASFGGQSDTPRSANGTYTWTVVATAYPGNLTFTPSNTARLSLTGVSLVGVEQLVTPAPSGNTAIGTGAAYHQTIGSNNVGVGLGAMRQNGAGSNNTAIGVEAGATGGGSSNVLLGRAAGYYEIGSNRLHIDNQPRAGLMDARNKALIYGFFDADTANQWLLINARNIQTQYLPVYADNAAATAGGLSVGQWYRTATGQLMVRY